MEHREIYQIAGEIRADWGTQISPYARPYLNAMFSLNKVTDNYGDDSGKSIILYFLSNASTWKGEVARRVKAELKSLCNIK